MVRVTKNCYSRFQRPISFILLLSGCCQRRRAIVIEDTTFPCRFKKEKSYRELVVIGNRGNRIGTAIGNWRGDKRLHVCNSSCIRKQSKFKSTRKIKDRADREREREKLGLTACQTFHPFATCDSVKDRSYERKRKRDGTFAPWRAIDRSTSIISKTRAIYLK